MENRNKTFYNNDNSLLLGAIAVLVVGVLASIFIIFLSVTIFGR